MELCIKIIKHLPTYSRLSSIDAETPLHYVGKLTCSKFISNELKHI